jgi:hypothetical protein
VVGTWIGAKAPPSRILTRERLGGVVGKMRPLCFAFQAREGAMGAEIGEKSLRLAFERGRGREWLWAVVVTLINNKT